MPGVEPLAESLRAPTRKRKQTADYRAEDQGTESGRYTETNQRIERLLGRFPVAIRALLWRQSTSGSPEFCSQFTQTLRANSNADIHGSSLLLWKKLLPVNFWIEFGGNESVDVEPDAYGMSSFRRDGFTEFDTLLDEKFGLGFASFFPHGAKPRNALLPIVECFIRGKFRIRTQELDDGSVTNAQQRKEMCCKFFC